jgi:hypothetical protein
LQCALPEHAIAQGPPVQTPLQVSLESQLQPATPQVPTGPPDDELLLEVELVEPPDDELLLAPDAAPEDEVELEEPDDEAELPASSLESPSSASRSCRSEHPTARMHVTSDPNSRRRIRPSVRQLPCKVQLSCFRL